MTFIQIRNTGMEKSKIERAKKRVDQLKGFYIHLSIYLMINMIIWVNFYIRSLDGTYEFWSLPTFFTTLLWGVGVAMHAANTFRILPFYRKDWERRQIDKLMKEDQHSIQKYK